MPEEKSIKELSDHILSEMHAWNASHPKATVLHIEEKARELVSQLEAHLIQESALERERDEWSKREASPGGIYKPQQAETCNWKEPMEPVPTVAPGFPPSMSNSACSQEV